MKSNVTLITLTVADIAKATRFYESLGFAKSSESQDEVSFFRAGGIVLSLWDREAQIQDANAGTLWDGNGGIVVAQNVASEAEVDAGTSESESCRSAHLEAGNLLGRLSRLFRRPRRTSLGDRSQPALATG